MVTKFFILIVTIGSVFGAHEDTANGDVIVTYAEHSDVINPVPDTHIIHAATESPPIVETPSGVEEISPETAAENPEDKGCTCGTSTRSPSTESTATSYSTTTEPFTINLASISTLGCTCGTAPRSPSTESTATSYITTTEPFTINLASISTLGTPEPEPSRRNSDARHKALQESTDEVVFVPNEASDDEYLNHAEKTVGDLFIKGRTLDDLVSNRGPINMEQDVPKHDDVFVTGLNNDEAEQKPYHDAYKEEQRLKAMRPVSTAKPVDCNRLNCNNKVSPVCGAKMDQNKWKYRSFLNECFFNKVNCAFNYVPNKYIKVDNQKCVKMVRSQTPRPQSYYPAPPRKMTKYGGDKSLEELKETRRVFQSRRSSSLNLNGQYCSHMCPVACPEVYEPECAISSLGQKRVFVNHCKLDFESCRHNLMWQVRPIGECVGQEAAEVRQNRAFIAWMQKIGIIDNKGKFNKT